jgi:hypothetical protein
MHSDVATPSAEPIERARAVLDNLPPELVERFDTQACIDCGGVMRRTGSHYRCDCGYTLR